MNYIVFTCFKSLSVQTPLCFLQDHSSSRSTLSWKTAFCWALQWMQYIVYPSTSGYALGWCKTPGRCDPLYMLNALLWQNGMFDVNHFPPLPLDADPPNVKQLGLRLAWCSMLHLCMKTDPSVLERGVYMFDLGLSCEKPFVIAPHGVHQILSCFDLRLAPFNSTSGHNGCNSSQSGQSSMLIL